MKKYDYLIVGAGFFGAVFACEAKKLGKRCLVIDRRNHIGGNAYTETLHDIHVHKYGAHIFHASNKKIWDYINNVIPFNNYINSPIANYQGKLYNLPFNMNTFYQLWGVKTPDEAILKIEEQRGIYSNIETPANLEEQALKLVGKDIYEKLIKGYSEKQWGMKAEEIPAFVITRLPLRFIFDNNYFNDIYQGIPIGGYTLLFEKLLNGVDVKLNCDFIENRNELISLAEKIVYSGPIDAFYDYRFGELSYRSLFFEHKVLTNTSNYQGNAVINYTEASIPYTRSIEHKHFEFGNQSDTVVTFEYPQSWTKKSEPYYPINDNKNTELYKQYKLLADKEPDIIFGGRLAEYKYYDMDKVIERALSYFER